MVEFDGENSGFLVDPKRWIVERPCVWFRAWHRLDREYERRSDSSEKMVDFAMLRIGPDRLHQTLNVVGRHARTDILLYIPKMLFYFYVGK
jgi:hypothetical protein